MGAYYTAVINKQMYLAAESSNGSNLMEHYCIGNNYVDIIMYKLINNPKPLVWLCDYHKPDQLTELTWDTVEEENSYGTTVIESVNYLIINHTKEVCIDMNKLHNLYIKEGQKDWMIHPIPLLCNSDNEPMGGGDYHSEDSRRSTWCGDTIEVTHLITKRIYKDVTEDCLFYE